MPPKVVNEKMKITHFVLKIKQQRRDQTPFSHNSKSRYKSYKKTASVNACVIQLQN